MFKKERMESIAEEEDEIRTNKEQPNKVNVPSPQQISTGNVNYQGYKGVVELFNLISDQAAFASEIPIILYFVPFKTERIYRSSLNATVSPCEDFYQYTCGNFNTSMSFDMSDSENVDNMVDQLSDINYVNRSPDPVKQVSWYFLQCVNARLNWTNMVKDGAVVMNAIKRVAEGDPRSLQETQFPFYMLYQTETVLAFPDSAGLGYLFGGLFQRIVSTMSLLAKTQNIKLDFPTLLADAKAIVEFDHLLATTYSTDDTTRRHYDRSYNPMTIDKLSKTYSNISWTTFVSMATIKAQNVVERLLTDPAYQYIVMEPEKLQKLNDNLGDPSFVSSRTIVNYIYYHVVDANVEYLPWKQGSLENIDFFFTERPLLGRPRRIRQGETFFTLLIRTYANARVFIDKIYPTNESRIQLREHVAKMVSSILIGFRTMIDQLNWMTSATKKGAYSKIDNLVKNIAYPDWITDDAQLTSYYKDIDIQVNRDDYLTIMLKIGTFNNILSWNMLVSGSTRRQDFNGPPGTTNAWYQPQLNSITFPAAILHQPFYDPTWPTAVNFGGLGVVAGHELTHGFDDEGVQWDGTGMLRGRTKQSPGSFTFTNLMRNLHRWMDDASKTSFDSMAHCVVKEYDEFCPLNKTAYGTAACLDGAQTQGENIADNGGIIFISMTCHEFLGIHAAYRAYRNFINLYGPDPQLPDEVLQEFTSEQLFFLSFARVCLLVLPNLKSRVWCQQPSVDQSVELQILLDPHSPAKYRVFGTIQNFAAFKDAFHCPSSAYAPDKHCDVWVSDIDSCK
uniref:Peptidase_M13 domain-containing protein n=1 Tax=Angiostrongylus cantonensis TaxID=6313 RepID=A0A0K0DLB5_ANGCA